MKSFIYNQLNHIFKDQIEREIASKKQAQREIELERQYDRKLYDVEFYIGKPVIVVSNEFENPVIGFGERVDITTVANKPLLIVHDYIINSPRLCAGKTFLFNEQMFNFILDADKNALIVFLYTAMFNALEINKKPMHSILDKDAIHRVLVSNGFYTDLGLYRVGKYNKHFQR